MAEFIVTTKREVRGGNDGKPLDGVYVCTYCDNMEAEEREVTCWYCDRGEMVYVRREHIARAMHQKWGTEVTFNGK